MQLSHFCSHNITHYLIATTTMEQGLYIALSATVSGMVANGVIKDCNQYYDVLSAIQYIIVIAILDAIE